MSIVVRTRRGSLRDTAIGDAGALDVVLPRELTNRTDD